MFSCHPRLGRCVGKRSSQISVRVIERGEIGFRMLFQNSDGGSFLGFDEMDPFNRGAAETQHRVVLLAEHALFPAARLRLSLYDKFVSEFVLVIRRAGKMLSQNFTAALDGFAVGIARVTGF
jgi:hypothetical protein